MYIRFDLLNIPTDLTDFQKVVFTGLFGLATAVLIYWLNRRASKKSDFKKSVIEFRAAFTEEINKLERPYQSIEADKPQMIVRNAAIKHKNAMDKFRHHIDKASKPAFDDAWKAYEGENKYVSTGQEDQKDKRKLALANINAILKFTEQHK